MSRFSRSPALSALLEAARRPRRPDEPLLARVGRAAVMIAVIILAIPIAAVLIVLVLLMAAFVAVLALFHSLRMAWRRRMEGQQGRENVRVIARPPVSGDRGTG